MLILPPIIGIMGAADAGKDTAAGVIESITGIPAVAFADPLKMAASIAFAVPLEYFYDPVLKETTLPEWGMSPRKIAQLFGTDAMRGTFGDDIWVNRMRIMIEEHPGQNFTISDVRFLNEIAFVVKDKGGIILGIERPDAKEVEEHESEELAKQIHEVSDVVIVNDGTLEEFVEKVRAFITPYNEETPE